MTMRTRLLLPLLAALSMVSGASVAATFQVTNSGLTFSPAALTIQAGDTVTFSLASMHNAVEVSQATWNAGGSTPLPGGFAVGFGGGTIVLTQGGTHFYVCQPHASIGMKGTIVVNPVTGIVPKEEGMPASYGLEQGYPNPFNPTTTVRYRLPNESRVLMRVHDLLGRAVATLADGIQAAGIHSADWDAAGKASGVYIVRLDAIATAAPARRFSGSVKILLQK